MNRWTVLMAATLACVLLAIGCSQSGSNPITTNDLTANSAVKPAQTQLWGLWDVYIDIPTQTATAVLNRSAMFTANVTTFVNKPVTNLAFKINDTPVGTGFVDVDIDVTIKHPFPGLHAYDGYDVRGVFMGDGSVTIAEYGVNLKFGTAGIDQVMLPDPDDHLGGPDGFTRWFNKSEFTVPGLVGYTPGTFATKGYNATATLCPYKYFADGLSATGDVWDFLSTTPNHGVFTAGAQNVRNYYLRFPTAKGVKYSYAVIASWIDETTHPANAPEAMAVSTIITPDVYFVSGSDKGGSIKLDVSVKDWDATFSTGAMEDYTILVSSPVVNTLHTFTPSEMTPTGGNSSYSTYHVEIPADNVTSTDLSYFWVICEEKDADYTGPFTPGGGAPSATLASFFKYDLVIADHPYNKPPICDFTVVTPMPASGFSPLPVEFNASGSSDPDPGDTITYAWDFDGDNVFGETTDDSFTGTAVNPTHGYTSSLNGDVNLKVSDNRGGSTICSEAVNITVSPSKNITLRSGVTPKDLGVDHGDGDLLILYSDGQVWRYLASALYQTGSSFYTGNSAAEFIDVNTNGDSIIAGNRAGTAQYGRSFNSTGSPLSQLPSTYCTQVADVGAITTSYAGYSGYHMIMSSGAPLGLPTYQWINWLPSPSYPASGGNLWTNGFGAGNLDLASIVGFEFSKNNMDRCWYLEKSPEYRLEAYSTTRGYAGQSVGGSQSDGMTGFNDPKDVTRDNNNNVFVLDLISTGAPLVKKYNSSLGAVGSFGDSTSISGTPLRIEGSNFNGNIFVLHSNGLSIFFPSEMP